MKEHILLYKIRAKQDSQAFGEIYDLYIDRIYRFVALKVSHRHDAEDITSDVFLQTWNYLTDGTDRKIKSIKALLYTIARNKVIDYYRSRARQQEKESVTDLISLRLLVSESDPAEDLAKQEAAEQLFSYIRELKQEYQEVLLLKHIEGYSTAEIATITKRSQASVRVTLHRAMNKLKKMMTEGEVEKLS